MTPEKTNSTEATTKCSQSVNGSGWTSSRCTRKATVVEDGKSYCTQHRPSKKKERHEQMNLRINRQIAISNADDKLQEARNKVIAEVRKLYETGAFACLYQPLRYAIVDLNEIESILKALVEEDLRTS